jgi:hypothetical protein
MMRWTDVVTRAALFLMLSLASCGRDARLAEFVIVDANVLTMAEANPRADAIAVAGGRFIAVGKRDRIRDLIGEETRIVDLGGKTVLPGFNDAHMHPLGVPPGSVYLGPKSISSMDELLEALRARAREIEEGEWILGWGYEDSKLGRHPERDDLDRVSRAHPISAGIPPIPTGAASIGMQMESRRAYAESAPRSIGSSRRRTRSRSLRSVRQCDL